MNHAAIIAAESERPYQNRAYTLGLIDQRHFDALNPGGLVLSLNGYCLDALDELPAGCMCQFVRHPAQHYVTRGVSLAEQQDREALAKQLIAEILAEEAANKE